MNSGFSLKPIAKEWYYNEYSHWGKKLVYKGRTNDLDSVVNDVVGACDIGGTNKESAVLGVLLLNLVYIDVISEGKSCLGILLGSNQTGKGSIQYDIYGSGRSVISKVVHSLCRSNLILHKQGVVQHSTKIKFTSIGLGLVNGRINPEYIVGVGKPVYCKDRENKRIYAKPSTADRAKGRLIDKYNRLITDTHVSVCDHPLFGVEKIVFRLFADNSCQFGGRLYGAIYQRIKKELRRGITIIGEKTVEVDIKSTHPLLIYAREGVDITKNKPSFGIGSDPYKEHLLFSMTRTDRKIVKSLVVIALNAERKETDSDEHFANRVKKVFDNKLRKLREKGDKESLAEADVIKNQIQGYRAEYSREYEYVDGCESGRILNVDEGFEFSVKDIVLSMLQRHKKIKHWFGSEAWKKLNKLESDILLVVVRHFTDKNIPVLMIHDSVRIASQYEDELVAIYQGAIEKVLGFEFHNKAKLVTIDRGGCGLPPESVSQLLLRARLSDKVKALRWLNIPS